MYSGFVEKNLVNGVNRAPSPLEPLTGGVQTGGFPIWTCPSFFVLLRPFWDFPDFFRDFPDLSGDSSGIFPICPFPLSQPINSASEEQSRKGL